jgi:hypothetical protein
VHSAKSKDVAAVTQAFKAPPIERNQKTMLLAGILSSIGTSILFLGSQLPYLKDG